VLALGLTVILSTFVLGVHWVPDMLAGVAVGVLSVTLAMRFFYLPPEVTWEAGSTSLSSRASHSTG
jgi:membrane-associated phospholipid phosphatase